MRNQEPVPTWTAFDRSHRGGSLCLRPKMLDEDLVATTSRRCGLKTLAGGGNLSTSESHCPGPKMWNQDPRLAGGGNLSTSESHCPGPKMWNQDPRTECTADARGRRCGRCYIGDNPILMPSCLIRMFAFKTLYSSYSWANVSSQSYANLNNTYPQ